MEQEWSALLERYGQRVVLHQGVYHQIKRMFGVYGAGVNALHREAIGGVALDAALAYARSVSEEESAAIREVDRALAPI